MELSGHKHCQIACRSCRLDPQSRVATARRSLFSDLTRTEIALAPQSVEWYVQAVLMNTDQILQVHYVIFKRSLSRSKVELEKSEKPQVGPHIGRACEK